MLIVDFVKYRARFPEVKIRKAVSSDQAGILTLPLRRAARFYEKNGYRRTGGTTDFFGMVLFEYEKALEPK